MDNDNYPIENDDMSLSNLLGNGKEEDESNIIKDNEGKNSKYLTSENNFKIDEIKK